MVLDPRQPLSGLPACQSIRTLRPHCHLRCNGLTDSCHAHCLLPVLMAASSSGASMLKPCLTCISWSKVSSTAALVSFPSPATSPRGDLIVMLIYVLSSSSCLKTLA
uniref:Uncharacterized protein n=1 Tax=Arundo donax TaxID=35708 RepID=A0A0A9B4L9_ARUDO